MSLKEYEDLKKIRLDAGEKSRAHYKSVDLPGQRTRKVDSVDAVRARIAAMKAEREGTKPKSEIVKMNEPDLVAYANSIGIDAHVNDLKADTLKKVLDKLGLS